MLSAVRQSVALSAAALSLVTVVSGRSNAGGRVPPGSERVVLAQVPTDADLLGTLHQINVNEIKAAQLAETMSRNNNVRALASQIISDHTTLDQQTTTLAAQLGITPTTGDSTIARQGSAELDNLRARNGGATFDLAFSGTQVQDHMQALALVESARRTAQNVELKTALVRQIRPVISRHLQMAKSIRAGLGH